MLKLKMLKIKIFYRVKEVIRILIGGIIILIGGLTPIAIVIGIVVIFIKSCCHWIDTSYQKQWQENKEVEVYKYVLSKNAPENLKMYGFTRDGEVDISCSHGFVFNGNWNPEQIKGIDGKPITCKLIIVKMPFQESVKYY
jgi:hypothetical protein